MNGTEERLLVALERGLPLTPRPFADLARGLGCGEAELFAALGRLRGRGWVRRFGGVFDARRLGYRSALCAARAGDPDSLAARLTPLAGVTHCYLREAAGHGEFPNLWFTLSEPMERFETAAGEVRRLIGEFELLPAVRRFKVDVVFGGASRVREESVDPGEALAEGERRIVRALEGDTEARPDYFAGVAAAAGVGEGELLATLGGWMESGRLKRIGLLLRHRSAGWLANGMCCWRVAPELTLAKGRALAACDEVTHCYERPAAAAFPYNLFAMVHARELREAEAAFARLNGRCGLADGVMLVSTREYKKTSMRFFMD